jgi:hypothetical protein
MANEFSYLLVIGVGLVFTVSGYKKKKIINRLRQSGIKVDGVVFSLEYDASSPDSNDYDNQSGMYYPVIRYLTIEKEWVTEKYMFGSYPSKYKEGDTVPVIYDRKNIKEFVIDDNSSKLIGYLLWFGPVIIAADIIVFIIKRWL